MKLKVRMIMAACLTLLASACSSSPQSMILGKWEIEGAPLKMTAEFDRDGTAKMTMFGQTVQGVYKLTNDNRLEWTLNGQTTKAKVNVTATELELTTDANQTVKYRKM